jgi:hypothetical protein
MKDAQWRTAWAIWIIYFAVAEYAANKSGDPKAPLSFFLRHTLGIPRTSWHRRAGYVALGSGVVWTVQHLYERNTDGSSPQSSLAFRSPLG